jgi:hypothetical protein
MEPRIRKRADCASGVPGGIDARRYRRTGSGRPSSSPSATEPGARSRTSRASNSSMASTAVVPMFGSPVLLTRFNSGIEMQPSRSYVASATIHRSRAPMKCAGITPCTKEAAPSGSRAAPRASRRLDCRSCSLEELKTSVDGPDSSVICLAKDPPPFVRRVWGGRADRTRVASNTLPRCYSRPTRSSSPRWHNLRIAGGLTEPVGRGSEGVRYVLHVGDELRRPSHARRTEATACLASTGGSSSVAIASKLSTGFGIFVAIPLNTGRSPATIAGLLGNDRPRRWRFLRTPRRSTGSAPVRGRRPSRTRRSR